MLQEISGLKRGRGVTAAEVTGVTRVRRETTLTGGSHLSAGKSKRKGK
jgi:hypothetical protein